MVLYEPIQCTSLLIRDILNLFIHNNTDELTKIFIKFCLNVSFQFIWTYCGVYSTIAHLYGFELWRVLSRDCLCYYIHRMLSDISILAINEIQSSIMVMEISCVIFGLQLNKHIYECEMLVWL